MDTATIVDNKMLTKETQATAAQAETQHNARARVTKDQYGSVYGTVKLLWEVADHQAG